MIRAFIQMRKWRISKDDLLIKFRTYIIEHKNNTKFTNCISLLTTLLKEIDKCLPSLMDEYGHCDTETTNHVEGFFGNLKVRSDHIPLKFEILLRSIFIAAKKICIWFTKTNSKKYWYRVFHNYPESQ